MLTLQSRPACSSSPSSRSGSRSGCIGSSRCRRYIYIYIYLGLSCLLEWRSLSTRRSDRSISFHAMLPDWIRTYSTYHILLFHIPLFPSFLHRIYEHAGRLFCSILSTPWSCFALLCSALHLYMHYRRDREFVLIQSSEFQEPATATGPGTERNHRSHLEDAIFFSFLS